MRRKRTPKHGTMLPIVLIVMGALLVFGFLIWQAARSVTTTSAPLQNTAQPANPPAAAQNIPAPEIERVSLPDSKEALDNQTAVFLDVRDPGSFEAGHIPGSINIPLNELEARSGELDPNDWIITYCT